MTFTGYMIMTIGKTSSVHSYHFSTNENLREEVVSDYST